MREHDSFDRMYRWRLPCRVYRAARRDGGKRLAWRALNLLTYAVGLGVAVAILVGALR